MTGFEADTNPPSSESVLLSVPIMIGTRPLTPKCSAEPWPVRPTTPVACASLTIRMAPNFSHRVTVSSRCARSPSHRVEPFYSDEHVAGLTFRQLEPTRQRPDVVVRENQMMDLGHLDSVAERRVRVLVGQHDRATDA